MLRKLILSLAALGPIALVQAESTPQVALLERRTVIVSASTMFEALSKAQAQNPGWRAAFARPIDPPANKLWEVTLEK